MVITDLHIYRGNIKISNDYWKNFPLLFKNSNDHLTYNLLKLNSFSKHTHPVVCRLFVSLFTVVTWDNGITQSGFCCVRKEARRSREWKPAMGFAEDNGSAQQGHLRSVGSALTSCTHYPVFTLWLYFSNTKRSPGKRNNLNMFVSRKRKCDETSMLSLSTHWTVSLSSVCHSDFITAENWIECIFSVFLLSITYSMWNFSSIRTQK